ncbi:ATP-binding cassette domain-containing protein [Streptacidiphilus sp. N1-3]|uniref:ATP-binding cassette domain-containing protein n=1 Tax=Streptacidiphilus alkalitolerans TaxID=3342712 RepID=A0ABV6XBL0_9ACTN
MPYPFKGVRLPRGGPAPAETTTESEELLFGGPLLYDYGFSRHELAAAGLSFPAMARRIPKMLVLAATLAWRADRRALLAVSVAELGMGLARAFGLVATNRVLLQLFAGGPTPERIRAALPALLLVGLLGGSSVLLSAVSTAATGRLEPKIEGAATVEFLSRAIRVELSAIQDEEFHRLLDSAQFGAAEARRTVGEAVAVANAVIGMVAAGGVLTVLAPVLLPLLVLIAVPRAWGAVRTARSRYASVQAWLGHMRASRLITSLLTDQRAAAEVRVHGVGAWLLRHFTQMSRANEAEQTRLARRRAGTDLASAALSGFAALATYGVLYVLLTDGQLPLAVAGTAVLGIRSGVASITAMVSQLNGLYESALYVGDLHQLCRVGDRLAIPSGGAALPERVGALELKDLTFSYPGRAEPAVDRVSLTIEPGTVIALVGANGSGKTTLAKLICGLLRADSGSLTWDGVEIGAADRDAWFGRIGLLAQDFQRWPFTARANVVVGRPEARVDEDGIRRAADFADAGSVVTGLSNGWSTILASGYRNSEEISGGQWQKVGAARVAYRDPVLLIADEPTSALDARAEVDAFRRIRGLAAQGTTVVLITHRLAASASADVIFVLNQGRLVEQGSHEELMAAGAASGPDGYAALYRLQAAQYVAEARIGAQRDPAEEPETV